MLQIIDSLQNSNYVLEQAASEPDPAILNVNADLVRFDEDLLTFLRPQEHGYVLSVFFYPFPLFFPNTRSSLTPFLPIIFSHLSPSFPPSLLSRLL